MADKTEAEYKAERAADTLLEAKLIEKDSKLHNAAINVIVKRQEIETLVIKDKKKGK